MNDAIGREFAAQSLELHVTEVFGREEVFDGAVGRFADHDLSRFGDELFEPGGDVYGITKHRIVDARRRTEITDNDRAGMFRTFWLKDRMPAKALIHGVTDGPHALAVPDSLVVAGEDRTFDLAGESVRVVRDDAGGVRAYGEDGTELQVLTSFWFAWSTFYPNTLVAE